MDNQLDMFRTTDPETSHEAAASIEDLRPRQAEVLWVVALYGPITHDDIARRCSLNKTPQSARSRCSELVEMGLVEWAEGQYGATDNGGKGRLWRRAWKRDK